MSSFSREMKEIGFDSQNLNDYAACLKVIVQAADTIAFNVGYDEAKVSEAQKEILKGAQMMNDVRERLEAQDSRISAAQFHDYTVQ